MKSKPETDARSKLNTVPTKLFSLSKPVEETKDLINVSFYLGEEQTEHFINDTCGARQIRTMPRQGTNFIDRGDSPRLPSSATGSGRRGELPTSLS